MVVIGIRLPLKGLDIFNLDVLLTTCILGRTTHMLLGCIILKVQHVLVLEAGTTTTYNVVGISPRKLVVVFMLA